MNAIVPASRRAKSGRQPPSMAAGLRLFNSELNGADGETLSGVSVKSEGEDPSTTCFSFFASEMTAQQALRLLACWQQIIREK